MVYPPKKAEEILVEIIWDFVELVSAFPFINTVRHSHKILHTFPSEVPWRNAVRLRSWFPFRKESELVRDSNYME